MKGCIGLFFDKKFKYHKSFINIGFHDKLLQSSCSIIIVGGTAILEIVFWIMIAFMSGSVPWALIVSKLISHKDVRAIGDGNPGVANAWKLGGWIPGILAFGLELGKSILPIYFAIVFLGEPSGLLSHIGLALISLAPVIGHGWSPFLKFKGGKSLAATWGSWIAITNGMALPIGCFFLALMHGFQKNHAFTVTLCLIGFIAVFALVTMELFLLLFSLGNISVVIYKHRGEYSDGLVLRNWVHKFTRVVS